MITMTEIAKLTGVSQPTVSRVLSGNQAVNPQIRERVLACAREHDFHDIIYAEDMQEAVSVCASYANRGENVLLSPACASWGMFKNYEERGRIFKECVLSL